MDDLEKRDNLTIVEENGKYEGMLLEKEGHSDPDGEKLYKVRVTFVHKHPEYGALAIGETSRIYPDDIVSKN